MKKIFSIIAIVLLGTASVYAQTLEEISRKMTAELEKCEMDGYSMDIKTKIIIIGTIVTHVQRHDGKMRLDIHQDGKDATSWSDGATNWDYDYTTNEVTITTKETTSSSDESELVAFKDLYERYKLTLEEETDEAWTLSCKKKSSAKDTKGSKKMKIVISKATYLPVSVTSKGSFLASMDFANIKPGVTAKDVTFNAEDWPGVKIIDNR